MSSPTTKEVVLELVRRLPDDVSLEAIMQELAFRKHVDEGLKQLDQGQTKTHDEVRRELQKWR
jgi:predicted transcriptional regulator